MSATSSGDVAAITNKMTITDCRPSLAITQRLGRYALRNDNMADHYVSVIFNAFTKMLSNVPFSITHSKKYLHC